MTTNKARTYPPNTDRTSFDKHRYCKESSQLPPNNDKPTKDGVQKVTNHRQILSLPNTLKYRRQRMVPADSESPANLESNRPVRRIKPEVLEEEWGRKWKEQEVEVKLSLGARFNLFLHQHLSDKQLYHGKLFWKPTTATATSTARRTVTSALESIPFLYLQTFVPDGPFDSNAGSSQTKLSSMYVLQKVSSTFEQVVTDADSP